MNIDRMLAEMRQQHEELAIAIRVFDRMAGGRAQKTGRGKVAQAMAMIGANVAGNGHANGNGRAHKTEQRKGGGFRPTMKLLPEVTPIPGVSVKGMSLVEAIPVVLKAAKRRVTPHELASLINAAGFDKPISDARPTAVIGAMLARNKKGVRRYADKTLSIA